uniref:Uncharacterized protein n=1 Tax=Rhodosorus marinus TaxID=101924 RepID=A0A7S0G881_9RHOD|mmetsp:Transcript_5781/g.8137  ORF Transcript_5781/g.8137 Transcript_5781/m.8137 type:complete len:508 (+) Transcript_5781:506-2029(+)
MKTSVNKSNGNAIARLCWLWFVSLLPWLLYVQGVSVSVRIDVVIINGADFNIPEDLSKHLPKNFVRRGWEEDVKELQYNLSYTVRSKRDLSHVVPSKVRHTLLVYNHTNKADLSGNAHLRNAIMLDLYSATRSMYLGEPPQQLPALIFQVTKRLMFPNPLRLLPPKTADCVMLRVVVVGAEDSATAKHIEEFVTRTIDVELYKSILDIGRDPRGARNSSVEIQYVDTSKGPLNSIALADAMVESRDSLTLSLDTNILYTDLIHHGVPYSEDAHTRGVSEDQMTLFLFVFDSKPALLDGEFQAVAKGGGVIFVVSNVCVNQEESCTAYRSKRTGVLDLTDPSVPALYALLEIAHGVAGPLQDTVGSEREFWSELCATESVISSMLVAASRNFAERTHARLSKAISKARSLLLNVETLMNRTAAGECEKLIAESEELLSGCLTAAQSINVPLTTDRCSLALGSTCQLEATMLQIEQTLTSCDSSPQQIGADDQETYSFLLLLSALVLVF